MVLCDITLVTLTEELWTADPGLLIPFYLDDVMFDGSARRSAQLLKLIMDRGQEWGYLTKPANTLFIADSPDQEEPEKR